MSISFIASGYSGLSSTASVGRATSTKTASTEKPSSAMSQSVREMRTADPSGINREIKVNGKVIGFIYNSGVTAIENEQSQLTEKLGWNSLTGTSFEISTASTAMTQTEFESWHSSRDNSTGRHVDMCVQKNAFLFHIGDPQ
nr:hypothetical protein [uncultured Cohaesibacter sp.]